MEFSTVEYDYLIRGLFALQQMQPVEAAEIQKLIERFNKLRFKIQPKEPL